jgi:hypothetical protein
MQFLELELRIYAVNIQFNVTFSYYAVYPITCDIWSEMHITAVGKYE